MNLRVSAPGNLDDGSLNLIALVDEARTAARRRSPCRLRAAFEPYFASVAISALSHCRSPRSATFLRRMDVMIWPSSSRGPPTFRAREAVVTIKPDLVQALRGHVLDGVFIECEGALQEIVKQYVLGATVPWAPRSRPETFRRPEGCTSRVPWKLPHREPGLELIFNRNSTRPREEAAPFASEFRQPAASSAVSLPD